jgi:hypothetical protein
MLATSTLHHISQVLIEVKNGIVSSSFDLEDLKIVQP